MKKLIYVATLPIVLFLFGCPIGMDFAPGTTGSEKIDSALLGAWKTNAEDPEFKRVTLFKKNETSFAVTVSETGGLYELKEYEFTGWNTVIDGQKIFYIKSDEKNNYYCYAYKMVSATEFKLYDISLLVGGIDAVTSTVAFREEISASLKNPECLKEEKTYTKI